MKDKDILLDILETEKCMAVNTVYAMNEASDMKLYKEYDKIFKSISLATKNIFSTASKLGFYKLEYADNTKINKTYNELNK